MDDDVRARRRPRDGVLVADIARVDVDTVPLGVVERGEVERGDLMAPRQQEPRQVDSQKARAAGDEITRHGRNLPEPDGDSVAFLREIAHEVIALLAVDGYG